MENGPMGVYGLSLICFVALFSFSRPVVADDDDGWESESGWEDLDDVQGLKKEKTKPMAMGPSTIPAGHVGIRLSGGYRMTQFGIHVGILDRLDLIAEAEAPWNDLGNTWIAGGGLKLMALGNPGGLQYTFKFKAYSIMYKDAGSASGYLPEGLAFWPSFMVGMNVNGGCFYGEVGLFLLPYVTGSSNYSATFMGMPAHFGGEIYITDWVHIFINVDLILGSPVAFFTTAFIGPFNIIETGIVFII